MVNWKVRLRNKNFWLAIVPAILLLIQAILAVFGVNADFTALSNKLLAVVNAVFVVLAILGIVNDPTTATLSDSKQALSYDVPKDDTNAESD